MGINTREIFKLNSTSYTFTNLTSSIKNRLMIISLFLALSGNFAYSQIEIKANLTPEENQLYQNSYEAFNNRDFTTAHRGFSQLLSLYPNETAFYFYFGASIIELKLDLRRGIDYVEKARQQGIYHAYFYIARAYHHLYDFSQAISNYETFKSRARTREVREFEVDRYIRMAKNGQELIRYAYELQVVYNRTIGKQNFQYSYDFSNFGGRLIVKPERFRMRQDRNIEGPDLMYISDLHNLIFMSSYGNRRGGSLNIYMINRDGEEWGEPQILPTPVNDEYDQAYPFIAADGVTLYFSSKGHNSMGGYDIFRSRYDSISQTWSEPENMDFPINTPFDDIMFVKDIFGETAFFASNRNVRDDRITVFRILFESEPQQRLLSNINEVQQRANLEVSMDAVAELKKREEVRLEQMKLTEDSEYKSTTTDTDISEEKALIEKTESLIDSIYFIAEDFGGIVTDAYTISSGALEKVKELRERVEIITNKTEKEILEKEIINLAQMSVVMFEISRNAQSQQQSINSQIQYHRNEFNSINRNFAEGQNVERAITELNRMLERINISNPVEQFIKSKTKELNKTNQDVSSLEKQIYSLENDFEELNKEIIKQKEIALLDSDPENSQKALNDIIKLEEKQRNIRQNIRDLSIDKEILNRESNILSNEIDIAQNLEESLMQYDYISDINLAAIEREISLLNVFLNQNNLRQISQTQNEIFAKHTFQPQIDQIINEVNQNRELIVSKEPSLVSDVVMETYEKINREIPQSLTPQITEATNLVIKKDSLNQQLEAKNVRLSETTEEEEIENLTASVNIIKTEIEQLYSDLENIIPSEYQDKEPILDTDLYSDLQQSKEKFPELAESFEKVDVLYSQVSSISQNLQKIKDAGFDSSIEARYLKMLKTEISEKITEEFEGIKDFKERRKFIESPDMLISINNEISTNLSQTNYQEADVIKIREELSNNYHRILQLKDSIENEYQDDIAKKSIAYESLKTLVDETKQKHITFLNEKISTESKQLSVYESYLENYKDVIPIEYAAIIERINELSILAEDKKTLFQATTEKSEIIEYLTKSEINKTLAVEYYKLLFSSLSQKELITEIPEFDNLQLIENLADVSQRAIIGFSEIPSIEIQQEVVFPQYDIDEINSLLSSAESIEQLIQTKISDYEQITDISERISAVNKIDSLNTELSTTLFELNKLILDNQKEQILFATNEFNIDFADFNNRLQEYIYEAEQAKQTNSYYLLAEVIVQGESLIRMQNEFMPEQLVAPQMNLDNIELFHRKQENNKSILADLMDQVNLESEAITTPATIETEADYISDIFNADHNLLLESIEKSKVEIENKKAEIESTTSRRERQMLESELESLWDNQKHQLIQLSEQKHDFLDKLEIISSTQLITVENDDFDELTSLITEAKSLRNTVINFSQFHSPESLQDIDSRAANLEQQAYKIITKSIDENEFETILAQQLDVTEQDDLVSELVEQEKDYEIINNLDDIISQDDDVVHRLEKLSVARDSIYNVKENINTNISELNAQLRETRRNRHRNRIHQEISLLESSYIDALQALAGTEKESLEIKYAIATDVGSNIFSIYPELNNLSDSLKKLAFQNIEQSIKYYDNILNYRYDALAPSFEQDYYLAKSYAETGLNNIEKSIVIKSVVDTEHPIFAEFEYKLPDEIFAETIIEETEAEDVLPEDVISERIEETEPSDITIEIEEPEISQVFERTEQIIISDSGISYYSDSEPIEPIEDVEVGLSYRIQIGAFNRPVPNETFRGISPIMIENVPNSRLLRYVVGLFAEFENARAALPSVRALGYSDSFIVAYYNGQRIPINQARQIEAGTRTDEEILATGIQIDSEQETVTERVVSDTGIDITQTENVFYTVQVGVYREQVPPARLYGLSPLIYDRLDTGLVRHLFGRYNDYNIAINEQNRIRTLGISDAFVTAYSDGRRISIAEAGRQIAQASHTAPQQVDQRTDITSEVIDEAQVEQIGEVETIVDAEFTLEYYVQIGAFRESLSQQILNRFNAIAGNYTIYEITSETALSIYRVGIFNNFQEALTFQNRARASGINDAFIVALRDGQRISIAEARSLE